MLLTLSGRSFIKIQFSSFSLFPVAYPLRIATQLQYYVKREKCKVNDVIFLSGCEARAINLGNKNVKIGIFTGGTSVRSKNIFTDISRYPTGKREIIVRISTTYFLKNVMKFELSVSSVTTAWLVISVYLSSLPVAHLSDAPRRHKLLQDIAQGYRTKLVRAPRLVL